jgi:hypothetical protein
VPKKSAAGPYLLIGCIKLRLTVWLLPVLDGLRSWGENVGGFNLLALIATERLTN